MRGKYQARREQRALRNRAARTIEVPQAALDDGSGRMDDLVRAAGYVCRSRTCDSQIEVLAQDGDCTTAVISCSKATCGRSLKMAEQTVAHADVVVASREIATEIVADNVRRMAGVSYLLAGIISSEA